MKKLSAAQKILKTEYLTKNGMPRPLAYVDAEILEIPFLLKTGKAYVLTPDASGIESEKPKIVKQDERSACKLCKKSISTGYYVLFKLQTYGPYGSSCIRKICLGHLL